MREWWAYESDAQGCLPAARAMHAQIVPCTNHHSNNPVRGGGGKGARGAACRQGAAFGGSSTAMPVLPHRAHHGRLRFVREDDFIGLWSILRRPSGVAFKPLEVHQCVLGLPGIHEETRRTTQRRGGYDSADPARALSSHSALN